MGGCTNICISMVLWAQTVMEENTVLNKKMLNTSWQIIAKLWHLKSLAKYRLFGHSPSSSLLVILSLSWLRHSERLKHSLDLATVLAGEVNISLSSEFVIMVRFCLLLMFITFVGL